MQRLGARRADLDDTIEIPRHEIRKRRASSEDLPVSLMPKSPATRGWVTECVSLRYQNAINQVFYRSRSYEVDVR